MTMYVGGYYVSKSVYSTLSLKYVKLHINHIVTLLHLLPNLSKSLQPKKAKTEFDHCYCVLCVLGGEDSLKVYHMSEPN